MFLKGLWGITNGIRTITSVIPTLSEKDFVKSRFIPKLGAHPSEGWGWGTELLGRAKVNKSLMTFSKSMLLLNHTAAWPVQRFSLCK